MPVQRLSGDYVEALTSTSHSAFMELALTLQSYKESIVLIGGWVPYFLIEEFGRDDFRHVGSIDIDLAVNPDKIDQDAYATIIELIERRGYVQRMHNDLPILFTYEKDILSDTDEQEYKIRVDFLTSQTFETGHRHRKIQPNLQARITDGCDIAFKHNFIKKIEGILPQNGETEVEIRMLDISGCLGMKGIVLGEAYREKDAYDIFSVVSHCLSSPSSVADEVKINLESKSINRGIQNIKNKFRDIRAEGPSWVANFLQPSDQTAKDRIIAEVFVTMKEFLERLE
jgi:hypothetical protein